MRGMCTEKIRTLSQLGSENIAFSPKPGGYRQTYIWMDSIYRVASLLKNKDNSISRSEVKFIKNYYLKSWQIKLWKLHKWDNQVKKYGKGPRWKRKIIGNWDKEVE